MISNIFPDKFIWCFTWYHKY